MQTNNLKLIKPMTGSANWGPALNQNFDKIDASYAKLSNNVAGLESRFNEIGIFSFLQDDNKDIDYVQFREGFLYANGTYYLITGEPTQDGAIWYYTMDNLEEYGSQAPQDLYKKDIGAMVLGNLDSILNSTAVGFTPAQNIEYQGLYYNDNDDRHKQLRTIPDYTAFYVDSPYIQITSGDSTSIIAATAYAFGGQWTAGTLLVKSSIIENNTITPVLSQFKQVLGGYYQPSTTLDEPNTVIFTKTATANAESTVEIYIPRNLYNAVETNVTLTLDNINEGYKTNQQYETTINNVKYYNSIQGIKIYEKQNGVNKYCLVDYSVHQEETGWVIKFDPLYLKKAKGKTFGLSYYVMSWAKTE